MLQKYNASLRVLGDISLVPDPLRAMMVRAMIGSRNNTGMILNIYFAYSSELEIEQVGKEINQGIEKGAILPR
jgi:undecaprenyl diphosphate synthase